jgi:RNA polymerase-binding transcription factor DksA
MLAALPAIAPCDAWERIGDRSFGSCIACKGGIDVVRLLAYATKRYLSCQQRRERIYAHEPTPQLRVLLT